MLHVMTMMHFLRFKGNQGLHLFVFFSFSITLKIDRVAIFFQWVSGKGLFLQIERAFWCCLLCYFLCDCLCFFLRVRKSRNEGKVRNLYFVNGRI